MQPSNGADRAALDRTMELHAVDASTAGALLREIKGIMDRLGVVFFLRQGTCLGAIRDNGFIPWDDDMDVGSVFGLHGLTEADVDPTVDALRDAGFFVDVQRNEHAVIASMVKSFVRADWACYHVIDESVFHYPGVRLPLRLFRGLKEIDFVGERFLVPNPPEEYLRLKYGAEWMTPKKVGYESDVVEMIPEAPLPGRPGPLRQFLARRLLRGRTATLLVLGDDGEPVAGAGVVVAGLGRSTTDARGYARFYLPRDEYYAVVVSYGSHREVLYMEPMAPGSRYVYRPDPEVRAGRVTALTAG